MEVAISRDILKCISTDTIRQVTRDYDQSIAVQRSSYAGNRDPIADWKESCQVLERSIENIVKDSLKRGISLVLEGVHIIPDRKLIDLWTSQGGVAIGVVLCIPDIETHEKVLHYRGVQTTKGAEEQLHHFKRIRAIHDEIVTLGHRHDWLMIHQKPSIDPRPIEILNININKEITKRNQFNSFNYY